MKKSLVFLLAIVTMSVNAQIKTLTVGELAPDFKLQNVDNKMISFSEFPSAKGFIIVFTCNTCPYAQAYEERIIELDQKFRASGYPVIAINPNDPSLSKGDSFTRMQERAKSYKYTFPYLFDPEQVTTNAFGAMKTPHLFLVQKTDKGMLIKYTGAIDDDTEETNPNRTRYVENAINELLTGKPISVSETRALGCSVRRAKT